LNIYSSNFKNCEIFKANKFDGHFNRYYYKKHIEENIVEIKNRIDSSITKRELKRGEFRGSKSLGLGIGFRSYRRSWLLSLRVDC
jgi:hypothetical protein